MGIEDDAFKVKQAPAGGGAQEQVITPIDIHKQADKILQGNAHYLEAAMTEDLQKEGQRYSGNLNRFKSAMTGLIKDFEGAKDMDPTVQGYYPGYTVDDFAQLAQAVRQVANGKIAEISAQLAKKIREEVERDVKNLESGI